MSTNTPLIGSLPFNLEIDRRGTTEQTVMSFRRNQGPATLARFMNDAGIRHGDWCYRITETFAASGNTRPVQVRRYDDHGVHIWVKPGDNGSGVKGQLIVTRDKSLTPEGVYQLLASYQQQLYTTGVKAPNTPKPKERQVDHAQTVVILDFIRETAGTHVPTMEKFVEMVRDAIDPDLSLKDTEEVLESLASRALLAANQYRYDLTAAGQTLLKAEREPPQLPSRKELAKTSTDPMALFAKAKGKLERLMTAPAEIAECQARRTAIGVEIDKLQKEHEKKVEALMAEEDALKKKESELNKLLDNPLLRALLGDDD